MLCEPDPPAQLVQVSTIREVCPNTPALTRSSSAALRAAASPAAVTTPQERVRFVRKRPYSMPHKAGNSYHGLACKVEGPPGPPHNGHAALVKVAVLASLEVVCRVTAAVASEDRLGVIALGALHTRLYRRLVSALWQCRGVQALAAACEPALCTRRLGYCCGCKLVQALTVAWNGFRAQHVVGHAVVLKDHGGLSSKALVRPVAAAAASQVQGTVRAGSGRVAALGGQTPRSPCAGRSTVGCRQGQPAC